MTDWAAKVLEGVVRYRPKPPGVMVPDQTGVWVDHRHVTDAIARMGAGDGLVERAEKLAALFELTRQTQKPDQGRLDAVDTMADLLARIAALTAQVAQRGRIHKSLSKRFAEANSARKATEAEAAALRAKVARLEGAVIAAAKIGQIVGFLGEDEGRIEAFREACGPELWAKARAALADGVKDGK